MSKYLSSNNELNWHLFFLLSRLAQELMIIPSYT
jgi:hypothetical protein